MNFIDVRWDESQHPRDEDGKFTEAGGGDGSGQGQEGPREGSGARGGGRARSAEEAQRIAATAAAGKSKLVGLPDKPLKISDSWYAPGPLGKAHDAAERYMRDAGLPYDPPKEYQKVDKERATRIANAFDEMKHDPDNPAVKASYDALAKEVLAQWQAMKGTGLKIEWIKEGQEDPYAKTPRLAAMDVIENNHWWGFPTDAGFGTGAEAEQAKTNNPMLKMTDEVIDGRRMRVNDLFRIVHDYFGHFKEGVGFRADGEDNAWRSHAAMFSDAAIGALTSETRGQNSWVNFGPHAEANRTASAADTVYAPQKIGLMPEWTWKEGRADPKRGFDFDSYIGKWDESEHPRDDAGRFTEAGGGGDGEEISAVAARDRQHPGEGYSANAYVDKHGVIHTDDVYDAQRALFEDRKVELDQVRSVSVLLQELGKTAQRFIEQGQKAPTFNLCNVTVEGSNLFCAECADEQTEILTADGWRRYDQIAVGNEVLTLNHETGMSEWQPLLAVNVFPAEIRLMVGFESAAHSSLTTLNHRWPITRPGGERRWTTSALLAWEDRIPVAAACINLPNEPIFEDEIVELVAWAWTEGNLGADALRIYQSQTKNPENCKAIRIALTRMFGVARDELHSIRATEMRAWRESYNLDTGVCSFHLNAAAAALIINHFAADKVVNPAFIRSLTRSQLKLFIERSIDGDGWRGVNHDSFSQRSEARVRTFEMACALLGRHTSTTSQQERRPGRNPDARQFIVSISRTADKVVRPVAIAKTRGIAARESVMLHDGIVWCPTTPNSSWLARRRGSVYFTGNSKGIPRIEMPQLDAEQTKKFVQHLKDQGYEISKEKQFASYLRATQNELNGAKVAGVANAMREDPEKFAKGRTIISRDDYILDGHHRWAAKVGIDAEDGNLTNDTKVRVTRIDISITKLLEEAEKFTGGKGKKPASESTLGKQLSARALATVIEKLSKRASFNGRIAVEHGEKVIDLNGRSFVPVSVVDNGEIVVWSANASALTIAGVLAQQIEHAKTWDESEHPRDDAGKFTDKPGDGGGSGAESAPEVVAYHGTVSSLIDKISKEGLTVTGRRNYEPGFYKDERGNSVFLTEHFSEAESFGEQAVGRHGKPGDKVAIFEVHVPSNEWNENWQYDRLSEGRFSPHDVPAEWIKKVHVTGYRQPTTTTVLRDVSRDVANDHVIYLVYMVREPDGEAAKD